jgi:hypothetical protein
MIFIKETDVLKTNFSSATLSTKNLTRNDLRLSGEMPVTNRLSHGKAFLVQPSVTGVNWAVQNGITKCN